MWCCPLTKSLFPPGQSLGDLELLQLRPHTRDSLVLQPSQRVGSAAKASGAWPAHSGTWRPHRLVLPAAGVRGGLCFVFCLRWGWSGPYTLAHQGVLRAQAPSREATQIGGASHQNRGLRWQPWAIGVQAPIHLSLGTSRCARSPWGPRGRGRAVPRGGGDRSEPASWPVGMEDLCSLTWVDARPQAGHGCQPISAFTLLRVEGHRESRVRGTWGW